MKISIIIINWNVKQLLAACLDSIYQSNTTATLETIVVDNASGDDSIQMVRDRFPQVKLIANAENLGFAKGNNIGVTQASGDFIFLLNPDTRLHADALSILLDYLQSHPETGVVAPQLLWPDGSVQSSRRRFPMPATMMFESTLLEQWFPRNRAARRYKLADVPPNQIQRVDWAVGAAVFLRREVWEKIGGLDETLFMYFEETDWFRRMAETQWQCHYIPQAKVTHYEGQSSGQVTTARAIRFNRSKLRYAKKHFGAIPAFGVRFVLLATFGGQWKIEAFKWLLGHKRPLRRARMRSYAELLRYLFGVKK